MVGDAAMIADQERSGRFTDGRAHEYVEDQVDELDQQLAQLIRAAAGRVGQEVAA